MLVWVLVISVMGCKKHFLKAWLFCCSCKEKNQNAWIMMLSYRGHRRVRVEVQVVTRGECCAASDAPRCFLFFIQAARLHVWRHDGFSPPPDMSREERSCSLCCVPASTARWIFVGLSWCCTQLHTQYLILPTPRPPQIPRLERLLFIEAKWWVFCVFWRFNIILLWTTHSLVQPVLFATCLQYKKQQPIISNSDIWTWTDRKLTFCLKYPSSSFHYIRFSK